MPDAGAYFLPLGDGRYRATGRTVGPWVDTDQHGGPAAALLAREMRRSFPREGMMFARLTFDLLGPIPVGEVEVRAALARPGRSVELLDATLRAGGREAVRARGWRVLAAEGPTVSDGYAPPPLPPSSSEIPDLPGRSGYLESIEWRYAEGSWRNAGPATVWTRLRVPLVPDEEPDGLTRTLVIADSGNGVSAELDLDEWLFINPELTVHLRRPAEGEWVCLDARTVLTAGGAGLALSTMADERGAVAHGAQSLLVRPQG